MSDDVVLRNLTETEIEVLLDRVFSKRKRDEVKKNLLKMKVNDSPHSKMQIGCSTSLDMETLIDLAELRDRRRSDLVEEAKDITEVDEDEEE